MILGGEMNSEYRLILEITDSEHGYVYYKFQHIKEKTYRYFMTTIGDGFVESEEIDVASYYFDLEE